MDVRADWNVGPSRVSRPGECWRNLDLNQGENMSITGITEIELKSNLELLWNRSWTAGFTTVEFNVFRDNLSINGSGS